MLDKSNTTLIPDTITLMESNGYVYLSLAFDNKRDNILIKLSHSDIKYLTDELNIMLKKSLIASEYR